jgi:murein DD-endopeptidase MepM/ murein hydrolase activator NlpD
MEKEGCLVLGSFRIRMLVVIVIAALVGLSLQSGHSSSMMVQAVIEYIMKDYGVQDTLAQYFYRIKDEPPETVPASGQTILQLPCEFLDIEQSYGWYYNQDSRQQEFFPAVLVKVKENSAVKAVFGGQVADISEDERGKTVLIDHGGGLCSSYGGLKEVRVGIGQDVTQDTLIAFSSQELYFQITGEDGPLNPFQFGQL